jgi:hypothetical protein
MAHLFRIRNRPPGSVRRAISRSRRQDPGIEYGRVAGAFQGQRIILCHAGNRLLVAQIHTQPSFGVDSIKPLFQMDFPNAASSDPMYDVSPDGQHFAVLTADRAKSTSITLLTNWPAELKK